MHWVVRLDGCSRRASRRLDFEATLTQPPVSPHGPSSYRPTPSGVTSSSGWNRTSPIVRCCSFATANETDVCEDVRVRYETTAQVFASVQAELARAGYAETYADERAFEADVWKRLRTLVTDAGWDPATACLTSHTWAEGRSAAEWRAFCAQEQGADVAVLDSKNRLDIVLRHPKGGSIGVEVKCLGERGHAAKLTQGIGQAMLALAHRDHTILAIHCGTVDDLERERLRGIATKISAPPRMSVIVVP